MVGLSSDNTASFDVFISYAHGDNPLAEQVEAALDAAGYKCFRASDDLNSVVGTKQWSEAIETLLDSTPVLVVLVTNRGLASRWVTFEWRAFHEEVLGRRRAGLVVPVLCEHLGDTPLPIALRHWQIIDLPLLGQPKGFAELCRLVDSFWRAARTSSGALDRGLRWTRSSNAPPPLLPQSLAPQLTSTAAPAPRPPVWALVGLGALLIVGVLLGLGLLAARPRTQGRGASAAFLGGRSATSSSVTTPTPSPTDVRAQPRAGWAAIEAYQVPTLENRNLLNRLETWDEARTAFERDCRTACSQRNRAALHFVAAEWWRLSGKLDEASKELELARGEDATWVMPLLGLAVLDVKRDPARAIERAKLALQADSQQWLALGVKGAAFAQQKKYAESIQELQVARDLAPEECKPLVDGTLALAYHSYGLRDAKAKALALSACTAERKVSSACAVLAEQALEAGDADAAVRYVELADRDDSVPLLMALGDAYQLKNKLDLAWTAWENAVRLKSRADSQGAAIKRLDAIESAVSSSPRRPPPLHTRARSEAVARSAVGRSEPTAPPRPSPTAPRSELPDLYGGRR